MNINVHIMKIEDIYEDCAHDALLLVVINYATGESGTNCANGQQGFKRALHGAIALRHNGNITRFATYCVNGCESIMKVQCIFGLIAHFVPFYIISCRGCIFETTVA